MSRDIPIIFSPPMVRAVLDEMKHMTRRLAKRLVKTYPNGPKMPPTVLVERDAPLTKVKVGDRLWVREEWRVSKKWDSGKPADLPARTMSVMFTAGGSIANDKAGWTPDHTWPPAGTFPDWAGRRRSSMHMPRWASRLTLLVTATKVERLHDISESDARAEGISWDISRDPLASGPGACHFGVSALDTASTGRRGFNTAAGAFAELWRSLHGADSWDDNPQVVCIAFSVIKANIDAPEARAA